MSAVGLIARDEIRLMTRNRVAIIAFVLVVLLTLVAVASSWAHQRGIAELRARQAEAAETAFKAQPDRHPHRVVHYGTFIFRPLGPLAAFDPGVDAFTGNSMFLEGHRQNSANFGDVRQSSLLVRFGQLTPAFVLQVVAPLLLIFLGYGALARETERGTVRVLMLQGAARGQIVRGKLLALGAAALLAGLPAMIGLVAIAGQPGALVWPMLVLALGYIGYLALWTVLILLVSASVRRSRDALLALVAVWAVAVVLLPRVAPDLASAAVPLTNRLQTEVAVARDLRTMGDSHNPDDPHFAQFKRALLARYGVAKVEDLPINYKGAVGIEGERLTSAVYGRYATANHAAQTRQNALVDAMGLLSPAIAVRSLSMAAAGTDLAGHQRFLEQAEAYRYALVQRLNRMQMEDVSYADDGATDAGADRRKRVSARNWQAMPDFRFIAPDGRTLATAALPGLAMVFAWLAGALILLMVASRRLGAR
ncbi:MAG: ABC transporter permease [Sphingomonas taxi]|uniref:ABC transporter permease n=1 Tax=Sphingomonas taxi TaxID=1549858 RepID=A0A2W4Z7W3_9SPHN|nr:MAG: ABC transporter permease [Sphingomonas taxi]